MLGHLIESGPRRRGTPGLRGPTVSLAVHSLLIFGAIVATRNSDLAIKDTPRLDTLVTYQPDHKDPPPVKMPSGPVVGPFRLPDAPVIVPTTLPRIDSSLVIDSTTLRKWIKEPDVTPLVTGPATGTVLLDDQVDEPPMMVTPPVVDYPDLLRQAGIEGTVVIEAVIDTTGRVEPGSVKVLRSSNHAFEGPARTAILGAVYRPGRISGRAVRVLVNVPVAFTIHR